ncbi:ATP-binding cassette domain-containing protein [Streptomyces sp. PA03-5A]|nr:ATP-binding cassette domain-containing protein [Streptomyces sp. PA03-5A]
MSTHTPTATGSSLGCSGLSFRWPDGTPVVDGLSLTIGRGRTGLVGANGTGKSTLLKLLAGRLPPTRGSVTVGGSLAYLPQDVTLDTALRVDQALGIAERRAALRAIEAGDAGEEHFETVGDDWDVEERALATLGSLGLGGLELDRTVGRMSGGETVLLRLAALLLGRPDVLLLDEPTNNLDLFARRRLHETVGSWRSGVLVVVSHDRELLERVDRVAELRAGSVTWYGGAWSDYEGTVAAQQETAGRALRAAEADVRRQRRELEEARIASDRRRRHSRKMDAQRRAPRIVAGERKRSAQESADRLRGVQEERLAQARERREAAADALRDDAEIRVDLPRTAVPAGRTVLTLRGLRPRNEIRARLARFLFRGARAEQPAGTLSGGERFRAALAASMLATPAPQLLMLDEPTNNLDVDGVRQLTTALASFRGALVIASHDLPFLESVGITRWLLVAEELHETTAEEVRGLLEDAGDD